ncbi:MAG: hypothetical protein Q8O41_07050 [Candidatus Methanoperedens sp.]|nr:hypothetical protein [Candidatus Methanoperedens sp.]
MIIHITFGKSHKRDINVKSVSRNKSAANTPPSTWNCAAASHRERLSPYGCA